MQRYIFILFIFFLGCKEGSKTDQLIESKYRNQLIELETIIVSNPNKVIAETNDLLQYKSQLNDATLCKIYQLAQKANQVIKKDDLVMSIGDSVRFYGAKYGDSLTIAKSMVVLPDTYVDYSKRKSMNAYIPMALRIFNQPKYQKEYAITLKLKVFQLEYEGDYQVSLDLLLKAYDIFKKIGEKKEEARIAQMIANVYGELNNLPLALKYYKLFELAATSLNDSVLIASANTNYGIHYRRINKDSSIYYYNKALAIHNARPFSMSKVQTEYNLANLYYDKKEYEKANSIYESILKTCKDNNYQEGLVMTYNGLSTIAYIQGNLTEAIAYMKESIALADSLKMTGISLRLMPDLIGIYYEKKDYKLAADASFKMKRISDSLLSNEKQIALIELEKKYQGEVKEKENQYLQVQLKFRQVIIVILTIALIGFIVLFRQRNRLFKEREISYRAIMQKYKAEKEERERLAHVDLPNNVLIEIEKNLSLYDKILLYYKNEQPYLNSKFRVDDLAQAIDSNQKDIAQTLKQEVNLNFSAFTNKYRVDAARLMFEQETFYNIKMEVIAEKSGFGTIQSFYNAFELYTGVKPGFYRSRIQSENESI